MSSEIPLPSSASVELFTQGMRDQANREIMDTAADPDWKVLSSPDYPGRVDSKEWIEKRKLRHPTIHYYWFTATNSTKTSCFSHIHWFHIIRDCIHLDFTIFFRIH